MTVTKFPNTILFPPPPEGNATLFGFFGYFTQLANALTDLVTRTFNSFRAIDKHIDSGITATITTAKLTSLGTNGSQTFVNGALTEQTAAT